MFAYTAATKLLQYPTMLAGSGGRDLLFSAALDFLVVGIAVWAVAFLASKTDKTFYELLKNTFGEIAAKIIFGFFAAFFAFAAIVPLFEQKLYVYAIFYDIAPTLLVFLPIFIFLVYVGSKSFTNIGRCADICMPVFLLSVLFVMIMSVGETDFTNLLPILRTPAKGVLGGALGTLHRFAEPCWLLMFLGRFRYKKHDCAKITLSYAAAALFILFFLAVFYGLYGELASSRQFAVSKVSVYFPAIQIIGRIDLIALYALETVMLFALALNIQLSVYSLSECTGKTFPELYSLVINAVLAVIVIAFDRQFNAVSQTFSKWLWIVFVIFALALPCLAWALKRRKS